MSQGQDGAVAIAGEEFRDHLHDLVELVTGWEYAVLFRHLPRHLPGERIFADHPVLNPTGEGALLQGAVDTEPDTTELHHLGHGCVQAVVAPGGNLSGVPGLQVPVPLLSLAELASIKASQVRLPFSVIRE
jgi:hypothetical protein